MNNQLNRGDFLTRVFFLAFFSFLTVAAGSIVIVAVDPARETVQAFDVEARLSQVVWFAVAEAYWTLSAWYTARLLLQRDFGRYDLLLPCDRPVFAAWVIKWTPRFLGLVSVVPIAYLFLFDRGIDAPIWLKSVPFAVAILFIGFVLFRRKLFGDLVEEVAGPPEPGYLYHRFIRITGRGWALIVVLFAISAFALVLLMHNEPANARWIGAPAILLLALGSWSLFGGFILIYLPRSYGWPSATPFALALLLLSAWLVENHNVPVGPPPTQKTAGPPAEHEGSADTAQRRPSLIDQWDRWLAALPPECQNAPIYLVAISGGATRAAFWGAYALAQLEHEARKHNACFARNIFAISGISGGSLGAAAFVTLLAEEIATGKRWPNLPAAAERFLGQDVLAPVLGYMLFPDGLQRFLPWPITAFDRSRGLEESWSADWVVARTLEWAEPTGSGRNWFREPLRAVYGEGRAYALPSLFLNTTRVSDGKKVLQSNVAFVPDDTHDLFAPGFLTRELSLAGSVHNSARFPYVSPAGRVWKLEEGSAENEIAWGYVVDGGYFENSGSSTLTQIIAELNKVNKEGRNRIIVITLSNSPSDGVSDYVCQDAHAKRERPQQCEPERVTPTETIKRAFTRFAIELSAPPIALYQTRSARAHASDIGVARILGEDSCREKRLIELRLPTRIATTDCAMNEDASLSRRQRQEDPPMSWFVNRASQASMKELVAGPIASDHLPIRRLCENLVELRSRIETGEVATGERIAACRAASPVAAPER